jgi:hypothetical protein
VIVLALSLASAQGQSEVRWVDDEPRAVLAILDEGMSEGRWRSLLATQGYVRLKEREAGMGRAFTDAEFRSFVQSPDLAGQRAPLRTCLESWSKVDVRKLATRALAYLPREASIRASVYPLIKPRSNSFVWDTEKDPAIMLYLDPKMGAEEFEKTVVHELHHVGYASSCPSRSFREWSGGLSASQRSAWTWLGAFGEGYAVLAAAGDRSADPMAHFSQEVKDAWRHGMKNLAEDMRRIEAFVLDTVRGKIKGDEVQSRALEFYGVQGPWYSVGYAQAVAIEEAYGRPALIECYMDPRTLMPTYNRAVDSLGRGGPKWSAGVMSALGV